MRSFLSLLLSALLLSLVAAQTNSPSSPQPKPLVLTHVTVVDTANSSTMPDMTVIIEGDRITKVEPSGRAKVPRGARVLDATGKYLIPGLWDMHVHLSWTKAHALSVLVANGVTGVRDLGGRLGELDEWRTKITAGVTVGPRIVRAGPILNGRSFNPLQMVPGNPDETRGVVRALKEVGVDLIKVHRRMQRDSYFAAIEEAKKQGLALVGHIPMTVTPEEASDAGQVTIEHTETLFEGTFATRTEGQKFPDAIRQFRASEAEKLFARFVKNRTALTPTLVAYRSIIETSDPTLPPDPRARYVAQSYKDEWKKRAQPVSAAELAGIKSMFAELKEVVRLLNRSGVTLLAGSDIAATRVPGFTLHDELVLLVEAGLTPAQSLRAATLTPAEVLKKTNDFGSVATGKVADLVLLDADPLQDIRNTQRIRAVIVGGKLLDRTTLDRLLSEAERDAQKN